MTMKEQVAKLRDVVTELTIGYDFNQSTLLGLVKEAHRIAKLEKKKQGA